MCLLACFNVLNLKGARGTYQVETRIQCAVFLSPCLQYLQNQYCDLETQKLDGMARPMKIIDFKCIYSGAKLVGDTLCTRFQPTCLCCKPGMYK